MDFKAVSLSYIDMEVMEVYPLSYDGDNFQKVRFSVKDLSKNIHQWVEKIEWIDTESFNRNPLKVGDRIRMRTLIEKVVG